MYGVLRGAAQRGGDNIIPLLSYIFIYRVYVDIYNNASGIPPFASPYDYAHKLKQISMTKPVTKNTKVVAAILTVWVTDTQAKYIAPESYVDDYKNRLVVFAGQFELCPITQKVHAHVYLEFHHKCRPTWGSLRTTIRILSGSEGNVSLQRAGSPRARIPARQGAINYVTDESKRHPGCTSSSLWAPTFPDLKFDPNFKKERDVGKETTKAKAPLPEDIRAYIETKPFWMTWDEILHENEESKKLLFMARWGKTYQEGRAVSQPRRKIKKIIAMYGRGGSGKTYQAIHYDQQEDEPEHVRYYRRNYSDGDFWGGGNTAYRGQRVIHLDEFGGQEKFSDFKEICDVGNQGKTVNVKNGGTNLNHETIVITSNIHPANWYRNVMTKDAEHQWLPFWRRITELRFFPEKRPDGTANIAGEGIEPYWIDQTDEWISLCSHDVALKHANTHWPIGDDEPKIWSYDAREGQWMIDGRLPRAGEQATHLESRSRKRKGAVAFGPRYSSDNAGDGPGTEQLTKEKWLELVEEIIGPLSHWSEKERVSISKSTLRNNELFSLVIFFLCNGLDPRLFTAPLIKHFKLSIKKRVDMQSIVRRYPDSDWKAWNIHEEKRM